MTSEEFVERLAALVEAAGNGGLDLETIAAELEDAATAVREALPGITFSTQTH